MFSFAHPTADTSVLILVDMQERLLAAMDKSDTAQVIARQKVMLNAARELQIPVIVTEQYPKGLGKTIPELSALVEGCPLIEKTSFSCFGELNFRKEIERRHFKSMVLMGIETHVCIQQTAIDALKRGFQVFLPVDAVKSRNASDSSVSLDLMARMDIYVSTSESILFSLLQDASHPAFKKVVALLK
jgi:nicotinamidase-related amidase